MEYKYFSIIVINNNPNKTSANINSLSYTGIINIAAKLTAAQIVRSILQSLFLHLFLFHLPRIVTCILFRNWCSRWHICVSQPSESSGYNAFNVSNIRRTSDSTYETYGNDTVNHMTYLSLGGAGYSVA